MPFDVLGPLPQGTTVLEASAGTGKTFTIAALVARYVAEGVASMEELLVVSFSRESTRELRERVRERLVGVRDALAAPTTAPPGDRVVQHLLADPAERAVRLRRLGDALASFDAATVTTTHGFCQQVLLTLGTAGDLDADAELLEHTADLVTEVADDLYLRKWGRPGGTDAPMKREEFLELAIAVASDPATRLLPDPTAPPADIGSPTPALRARIAAAVRTEVDRRKRRQHVFSYDDLLTRVADTLVDRESGPAARARLQRRYRVVLVDEFQDTDPVQWSILREAFAGHCPLVLIGDPKQAIYGFRGADVHAYLAAVEIAAARETLPTNWRSDAALLDGFDAIFRGAVLGDPRIRVLPVTAAHTGRMVSFGTPQAPARLRVLPRGDLTPNRDGTAKTAEAKAAIARDLAAEVVELLSSGAKVIPRDGAAQRTLEPGDLAVLVRTNKQATLVQSSLQQAGVPVVLTGRTSVFATPAAEEWKVLLEALEQPHRATRVRRLALTCFVGRTAAELDAGGDTQADALALRVRGWVKVLADRGVAALFETVSVSESLQPRVLATAGGERLLTDLRHLAESLHEAALEERLGLTALLTWLRRRCTEASREGGVERSRRLESDAKAVQVLTMHTSKGLEFPVVLVPFAWDGWRPSTTPTAVFHDELGERLRDVGGPGGLQWDDHVAQQAAEEVNDELRLTYVALTRAQSHLVLWWAPTYNTPQAPLHRLLLHDDPATPAPLEIAVPPDSTALAAFRGRAAGSNGGLEIEVIGTRPEALWVAPTTSQEPLQLARFDRTLDLEWRRTSYSALTSAAHDLALGSEAEAAVKDDEPTEESVADAQLAAPAAEHPAAGPRTEDAAGGAYERLRGVVSPWDALPGGTTFGVLVHGVLEELADPAGTSAVTAGAVPEPLDDVVARAARRYGAIPDTPALSAALELALATPLGPLAAGRPLQQLPISDRLAELDFELPLAGGDMPQGSTALVTELAELWRRHLPAGQLASYADVLATLPPAPLRGYLTGSIDAVLRVGPTDAQRYLVVDYKTNRLGRFGEPLTAWHYRPEALEQAMIDAHYPLQALLYSVALHRYLRWRVPAYDPDAALGGVLYLFLRGMCGDDSVVGDDVAGVFSWRPPAALIVNASDLLAGGQ